MYFYIFKHTMSKRSLIINLLFLLNVCSVFSSFINVYPRYKEFKSDGDPGVPLFLTPYIQSNRIDEGRNLALVNHSQMNFCTSYSGYLTVDNRYNSNLFFWYFKAQHNWENAPVVLWLQGGPGASSLFGLFTENGPFQIISDKKVNRRKYSWNLENNLIYIDNPVGTGFSFTDNDEGYAKTEDDVGLNLYNALKQFFTLFPELQNNGFYVTGESYGGKYVPAVSHFIHKMNNLETNNDIKINLKGIGIGNGLSDPLHQLKYGDYLYQLGLIDLNGRNKFHEYEELSASYIKQGQYDKASAVFDALMDMGLSPYGSVFKNLTGFNSHFNYINQDDDKTSDYLGNFIQSSDVRHAIHVGNNSFHDTDNENKVELHLKGDIMRSVDVWVSELLSHYHIVIYNGQLDIIVAYPLTENYLQQLDFNGSREYKTNPRHIWKVDNEIAGYVKMAGNLTEVLVRNAGHMVPSDQPKWAFDLITRLTKQKSFF